MSTTAGGREVGEYISVYLNGWELVAKKEVNRCISCGKLGLDDSFRFQCDDRLSCFMECCTSSNVWLNPL